MLLNAYYVEVDEGHKIDVLWHVVSALFPARVHVMMFDLESRVDCDKDIKYLFSDCAMRRVIIEWYSFYTIDVINTSLVAISNKRASKENLLIF